MNSAEIIRSKTVIINMYCVLLICMIIGSFADYAISKSLFSLSNPFGIIGAAYGEYPVSLGMIVSAVLMMQKRPANAFLRFLKMAGCSLLIVFGVFMACFAPTIYLSISDTAVYIIGAVCSIIAFMVAHRIAQHADPDACGRVGLILFTVIFTELIFVSTIKVPWGRARMRLVASDPRAYFMPWWQVGDSLKNELVAAGVAAEEFKSFPSGHVANASVMLLLPLFADIVPSLKGKEKTLLNIGIVWVILIAVSRIIIGAHYMTDVTVSVIITYTVILIVLKLLYKPRSN